MTRLRMSGNTTFLGPWSRVIQQSLMATQFWKCMGSTSSPRITQARQRIGKQLVETS
jgi:hypothetical protein